MALSEARDRLMEHPAVYAVWQAPFAAQKFAPVERQLRERTIRRVLDVGCGTGHQCTPFRGRRIRRPRHQRTVSPMARERYAGLFVQADLTTADLSSLGTFDTILVNSFLHHISG